MDPMQQGRVINISRRVADIKKSAIHEMTRLSKQHEDVAFLSWARPTSGTPGHIRRAAIVALREDMAGGYSETAGMLPLRKEIARKLKAENDIDAEPSNIIVTVGAVEGLSAAVMAVVDPGDEVILPDPTYSTHIQMVQLASGRPVMVPSIEEESFKLDLEAMEKAITSRTKAIMYCSPCNPTGAVFGRKQLQHLAEIAMRHDLMIITDEAYEYFTYDGHEHVSIGSLPGMEERTISCFTFTKNYAMTGWRIGYLHAHTDLIPHITKVHIPFAICAPVISQYAALAALQGPQDCVDTARRSYLLSRDLMCRRLDEFDSIFDYQKPAGSYLMFPRILTEEGKDSESFCKNLLIRARVSTTPGSAFGPSGESHLRLSFCVPEEMIDTAFDRMKEYFGGGEG